MESGCWEEGVFHYLRWANPMLARFQRKVSIRSDEL
jgi:hypothetical protein